MKYSIVPEMLAKYKIKFYDEENIEVSICKSSPFKYISPFEVLPHLIIDTFAKKTSRPEELVNIETDELKRLGFMITSIKAKENTRWFYGQVVIYRIESISNPSPNSKRIIRIPNYHKIKMDKANMKIRLVGNNAGYPHHGGGGNWIELKK